MAIKIKHKGRRRAKVQGTPAVAASETALEGDDLRVLQEAQARLNPRPNAGSWKKMARGLAVQKNFEEGFDELIEEHGEELGWDWATLWICHTFICEVGQIEVADELYRVLSTHFPRDYHTELCFGKLCRDFKGEYFQARDHMRFATVLWEGCEAFYHLGILYDLMGMPEFAFAMEERAFELADNHGQVTYKLKAQLSFNQAVAMWQAARPYGDIKAYLRRALVEWPEYDRAERFLNSLPDDDEADPRGRSSMQRLTDDVRKNMNRPAYHIIEPEMLGDE